jgi:hypothetical protein
MSFWIWKSQIVRSTKHATDVTVKSPMKGRIQFKDNLKVKWKGDGDLTCSLHQKRTRKSILHKCPPLLETPWELVRAWIGYEGVPSWRRVFVGIKNGCQTLSWNVTLRASPIVPASASASGNRKCTLSGRRDADAGRPPTRPANPSSCIVG